MAQLNRIPLTTLGCMDFGSRFLDTIERSGGVEELFRPNIGVSTLLVTGQCHLCCQLRSQHSQPKIKVNSQEVSTDTCQVKPWCVLQPGAPIPNHG